MKYYLNFAKAHPIAAITISVLTLVVAGLLYLLIQSDIRNIETHIANIDKNVSKIESSVTQTNTLLIKHIQSKKKGIGPHTHTKNEAFSDTQPKTQKPMNTRNQTTKGQRLEKADTSEPKRDGRHDKAEASSTGAKGFAKHGP